MDDNETISAEEVEARLPDGWDTENDGDVCVYAYAPGGPGPENTPASVTIEAVGNEMWSATWLTYWERKGFHSPEDDVTGAKERCIEWVAEKADELEVEV